MVHTEQGQMRASAGDALAKAFEMIVTPAIFGFGGWLADGRLGTFPLVTLVVVFGVFGYQVWRLARDYSARMEAALDSRRAGYSGPRPEAPRQP